MSTRERSAALARGRIEAMARKSVMEPTIREALSPDEPKSLDGSS